MMPSLLPPRRPQRPLYQKAVGDDVQPRAVPVYPPPSREPQRMPERQNRNSILSVTAFCALCLVALWVATFQHSPPDKQAQSPHRSLGELLAQLPPAFSAQRLPTNADRAAVDQSSLDAAIQETYERGGKPNIGCKLQPWHDARYAGLQDLPKYGFSRARLRANATTILIAMNLHNSAGLFGVLVEQLSEAIRFLGPQNVHISIYENGSEDDTGAFLILLAQSFDAIGTSYTILSQGTTQILDKDSPNRIQTLASLRNRALLPLFDASIAGRMPGGKFDEVLWINDIYWCTADLLEVIYQRRRRGAYQSCAVDWDWNMRAVYDRWVLRTVTGRPWYDQMDLIRYWRHDRRPLDEKPWPMPLRHDPEDRYRFLALRPLQVFSCWNGMTAFDAAVFLEKGIRFRVARSDKDEETGGNKLPTDIASECYLTSVDMWSAGMGKIVLSPRARVAYWLDDYQVYRKDHDIGEIDDLYQLDRSEDFEWVIEPPKTVAMQDFGLWDDRDKPERWAPWNEP